MSDKNFSVALLHGEVFCYAPASGAICSDLCSVPCWHCSKPVPLLGFIRHHPFFLDSKNPLYVSGSKTYYFLDSLFF